MIRAFLAQIDSIVKFFRAICDFHLCYVILAMCIEGLQTYHSKYWNVLILQYQR